MTIMKPILPVLCSLLLVACTGEDEDIRAWMAQQEQGMQGRVEPLPDIQSFPTVSYAAGLELDPFASSRIEPESRAMSEVTGGPDLDRQREPLEAYPLESMNMVGVLMQDDVSEALISVGGVLHQVRTGNYLGQDHGVVTEIAQGSVTLKELVEDINGDWVERTSQLLLQER